LKLNRFGAALSILATAALALSACGGNNNCTMTTCAALGVNCGFQGIAILLQRMKRIGKVDIPQEAFLAVLRIGEDASK